MSDGMVIVFGGTFDPVHNGHLAIAEQVLQAMGAAAVWFVPAAVPALHAPPLAPPEARRAMLASALAGRPGFTIRDDELALGGVSYTVDTMRELERAAPGRELWLLLGADAARSIRRWQRAGELLAEQRFVVVDRAGSDPITEEELVRLGFPRERTRVVRVTSPLISAAEVRSRARRGEALDGLVPEPVARLVESSPHYRRRPAHA